MWPLGHAAVAYLLYSGSTRWRFDRSAESLAVVLVLLGSQVPDLIDKPMSWYGGLLPTGRTLAHSLLFLIPLCLILHLVFRHRSRIELGIAFAIGALSHAIVDAIPTLWDPESIPTFLLYPIIAVDPYEEGPPSVVAMLFDQLTSPWFHLEFVLAGAAVYLWLRDGRPGWDYVMRLQRWLHVRMVSK